ncbi:hypothetical protein ACNKHL_26015 [Shigella flexneri]
MVDNFVDHCPTEMTQLELWGCPWSRPRMVPSTCVVSAV